MPVKLPQKPVRRRRGTGAGGNITINAGVIAALPDDNSIVANAFGGPGGNIEINTQGIFGAEFLTISASSELGVDGIVDVNTPDEETAGELVSLPEELADPSQDIAAGCSAPSENQFIVTGRGGLPFNPKERQQGQQVWGDVRDLSEFRGKVVATPDSDLIETAPIETAPIEADTAEEQTTDAAVQTLRSSADPTPPSEFTIVEATAWVTDAAGQTRLVASAPPASGAHQGEHPATCAPHPNS